MAPPERGWEALEQGWSGAGRCWKVPAHSSTSSPLWWGLCCVLRAEQLKPLLSVASPRVPALQFLLSQKSPARPRAQRGGTRGSNLCSPHLRELLTGTTEGNCCQSQACPAKPRGRIPIPQELGEEGIHPSHAGWAEPPAGLCRGWDTPVSTALRAGKHDQTLIAFNLSAVSI